MTDGTYPVQFSVDYPDRPLDRVTTLLRIFMIVPILIVLGGVSGGTWRWSTPDRGEMVVAGAGGLLFLAPLLLILFRQKYPRWWFDWNRELQRFSNRVAVYLALMQDRYPSTDEHQSVHLDYPYPDAARDLNRWLPLVPVTGTGRSGPGCRRGRRSTRSAAGRATRAAPPTRVRRRPRGRRTPRACRRSRG
jgi:hypothetical protein